MQKQSNNTYSIQCASLFILCFFDFNLLIGQFYILGSATLRSNALLVLSCFPVAFIFSTNLMARGVYLKSIIGFLGGLL